MILNITTDLENIPVDEEHEDEWKIEGEERGDDNEIGIVERTAGIDASRSLIHAEDDRRRHRQRQQPGEQDCQSVGGEGRK